MKFVKETILALSVVAALSACALLSAQQQTSVQNFLTGLANKATADIQTAVAVASTPNAGLPGGVTDQPGVNCGNALLAVQANVNGMLKAANVSAAGAVTNAEVLSLFIPGSPQVNAASDTLIQGCAVKIAQVNKAAAGSVVWFQQLAGLFAIQLAPAGA